jgi:hypothetical protein
LPLLALDPQGPLLQRALEYVPHFLEIDGRHKVFIHAGGHGFQLQGMAIRASQAEQHKLGAQGPQLHQGRDAVLAAVTHSIEV